MFITVAHCTTTSKDSACRIICMLCETNFAKTLVCERECNDMLWHHKQRISSNNDHHTPLLNTRIWLEAYNQAVAPGITRPLHATGNMPSVFSINPQVVNMNAVIRSPLHAIAIDFPLWKSRVVAIASKDFCRKRRETYATSFFPPIHTWKTTSLRSRRGHYYIASTGCSKVKVSAFNRLQAAAYVDRFCPFRVAYNQGRLTFLFDIFSDLLLVNFKKEILSRVLTACVAKLASRFSWGWNRLCLYVRTAEI